MGLAGKERVSKEFRKFDQLQRIEEAARSQARDDRSASGTPAAIQPIPLLQAASARTDTVAAGGRLYWPGRWGLSRWLHEPCAQGCLLGNIEETLDC